MENVILVIHLILALSLIGLILLQRSEGGGLGIGGGGGGLGSFANAGQTANALTRATAICATAFFTTSIILAILAGTHHRDSMIDSLDESAVTTESTPAADGTRPSSTPTAKHGDGGSEKIDSKAASGDKDVPRAAESEDGPQPQTGAPSAPISQ